MSRTVCPSVRSRPAQVPRQRGGNRDREWNRSASQAAMGIRSNEQLEWADDDDDCDADNEAEEHGDERYESDYGNEDDSNSV